MITTLQQHSTAYQEQPACVQQLMICCCLEEVFQARVGASSRLHSKLWEWFCIATSAAMLTGCLLLMLMLMLLLLLQAGLVIVPSHKLAAGGTSNLGGESASLAYQVGALCRH
jgi:hypothetical protein